LLSFLLFALEKPQTMSGRDPDGDHKSNQPEDLEQYDKGPPIKVSPLLLWA